MADCAPDEVGVSDDWPTGFAQVPDWITLHPNLKAQSVREYAFLAMHAPKDGRRRVAFPGQASIARVLQLGRSDKVTPYTRALEAVGAVRVEEIATPKGRAYRYVLRFNPPPGYTGPTSLSDFYGVKESELEGRWAGWSMATAPAKTGGQEGSPEKEGYPSPQKAGDPSPQKAGTNQTSMNQTSMDQTPETTAPSARSAADARRATAGGSAREAASGCAATDKTGPADVADDGQELGRTAAGSVPKPRRAAHKESPFPAEVRQAIYATEALLPASLRAVLTEKFPYGHLPNVNREVTAQALLTRSPDQLGERAARRWTTYGYERDHFDGVLRSPLGVLEELLRPTPYCPDVDCEDGQNLHTGDPCRTCEARIAQRRNDRRAGRWVPEHRPPRLYRDREQCEVCDKPFPGTAPDDLVCDGCQAGLDRARAFLTGAPAAEEPQEADPDHCATPPSSEYRRYREQQKQARLDALQPAQAPGAP